MAACLHKDPQYRTLCDELLSHPFLNDLNNTTTSTKENPKVEEGEGDDGDALISNQELESRLKQMKQQNKVAMEVALLKL